MVVINNNKNILRMVINTFRFNNFEQIKMYVLFVIILIKVTVSVTEEIDYKR